MKIKNIDPGGKDKSIVELEQEVFVWLDLLGYSAIVEDEGRYDELVRLLEQFQSLFDTNEDYNTEIISDGLILIIKRETEKSLTNIFKEIGEKQLQFILDTGTFIRGGIALGSQLNDRSNDNRKYISSGLAKSHNIENKFVSWPIVGMDNVTIEKIKDHYNLPEAEDFNLLRSFNSKMECVYFIDFLPRRDDQKKIFFDLLAKNIIYYKEGYKQVKDERFNPGVLVKYLWLLRYFESRFDKQGNIPTLKGMIL